MDFLFLLLSVFSYVFFSDLSTYFLLFTKITCFFITVHFWAPTFKWGISIANIADFSKPPEKLSYPQQIGLWPLLFNLVRYIKQFGLFLLFF